MNGHLFTSQSPADMHAACFAYTYLKCLAKFRIHLDVQVCCEVDGQQSPEPQHCHRCAFRGAEQRPEGSRKAGFKLQMHAEQRLQAVHKHRMRLYALRMHVHTYVRMFSSITVFLWRTLNVTYIIPSPSILHI